MGAILEQRKNAKSIMRYLKEGNYAIVSASKGAYTDEMNKQKTEELIKDIKAEHPSGRTLVAKGWSPNWGKETSVFVGGLSKEKALELGKKYGQDMIISDNKLYRTIPEKFGEEVLEFDPNIVFKKKHWAERFGSGAKFENLQSSSRTRIKKGFTFALKEKAKA